MSRLSHLPEPAGYSNFSSLQFWSCIGVFWFAGFLIHWLGGFYYPQPYCDEAYFFYQARSFANSDTFFAPELHSHRTLYWMPYGYPFLSGLVFKYLGINILWMRHISFFFMSGAYLTLAFWIRDRKYNLTHALLLGLFFLSSPWVFNGNVARMESTVVACFCAGLTFGAKDKWSWAWFSVCCTTLFHPIGLSLILCFGLFWWLMAPQKHWKVVLIPGILFAPLWVLANWGFDFPLEVWLRDWQFQVAGKTSDDFVLLLFRWHTAGVLLVMGVVGVYLWKTGQRSLLPWLCLAPLLYLIRIYGRGGTYGIYTSVGIFVLAVIMVEITFSELAAKHQQRWTFVGAFGLICAGLLASASIHIPFYSKNTVHVEDIQANRHYLLRQEIREVQVHLDSICVARGWKSIYIYPESVGARIYHPSQKYVQIIHNFEDTYPDGFLFFSRPGDSFEEDRRFNYQYFQVRQEEAIPVYNGRFGKNWSLFANRFKKLNPNRVDALNRCAKAGISCPDQP